MAKHRITAARAREIALETLHRDERGRNEIAAREAARDRGTIEIVVDDLASILDDPYPCDDGECPFGTPPDETDPDVPRHVKRAAPPRRKKWGIEQTSPYVERWWFATEESRDRSFHLLTRRVGRWDRDELGQPVDKYRKLERYHSSKNRG